MYYLAAVASTISKICVALTSSALLHGCAGVPLFRGSLPEVLDTENKTIAVVGDLQLTPGFVRFVRRRENNAREQQLLITDLHRHVDSLAALIIVGDLVYAARSDKDWEHFDSLMAPFAERMPILPAIGNHDYPCYLVRLCRNGKIANSMKSRFPWMVPGKPYSVNAGNLLLLFIDSETELEAQSTWLKDQLSAAAETYSAALVFFHRPAFSNSIDRGASGNVEVQRFIVPAVNAAALPTAVFSGHIHGFEHIVSNDIHYVTTAGGGGPRGPMPVGPGPDAYRGPECVAVDGTVRRPFNYLLLRETNERLRIEVHGFCRGDTAIGLLDTIEIKL